MTRIIQDCAVQAFQMYYENWKKHQNLRVVSEGEYFEGDHIDLSWF